MLLPIKPICNKKKVRRDGTSIIFIQYCFSSTNRTLLNTEIAIPPQYWDARKLCITKDLPESYGNSEHLNNELTRLTRVIEDLIAKAKQGKVKDIGAFIKRSFNPMVTEISGANVSTTLKGKQCVNGMLDVFAEIDCYIASKKKKVKLITIAGFRGMKDHLFAFQKFQGKEITFSSFTYEFYQDFIDFLTFDYVQKRRNEEILGLKRNTIGKTIKRFRWFIADRIKRKIIPPIDLSDYKVPSEETDAIYLSYDEISKIYDADLSEYPNLVEYRDLFVLACLTGLRFSDFSTLRPEDLRNDMLYKKQGKSDHWVVIPMRKEAKTIFTYQFQEKIPQLTNTEFNRWIKIVGKFAGIDQPITFTSKKGNKDIVTTKPKYEWITTHTARRSFCTNEFLAGTPVKLIMKISGHKNEKDFYRYIRITPEEAALKIQQLWLERDNMQALKKRV